jgi:hypothetical protein
MAGIGFSIFGQKFSKKRLTFFYLGVFFQAFAIMGIIPG